jgi:hypothetical protein
LSDRHLGEQARQSDAGVAAGFGEYGGTGLLVDTGGFDEEPQGTVAQFGIAGLHGDHEVGIGVAETHHDRGGEGVEQELLCRSRLHAGGSGDDLRAGVHADVDVDHPGQGCPRVGAEQHRGGPAGAGGGQRTGDVGCGSAGGEADRHVGTGHLGGVFAAHSGVVLRAFHRVEEGRGSSGVVGDHQVGGDAVGGWQLGGVDRGQPAGGPGAEVVDAPARVQRRDGGVHHPGQLRQHLGDGVWNPGVGLVDAVQDLFGTQQVDIAGALVACFGRGGQQGCGVIHRGSGSGVVRLGRCAAL